MKRCETCNGWVGGDGKPFGTIDPCRCFEPEEVPQFPVPRRSERDARDEAIGQVEDNNDPEPIEEALEDARMYLAGCPSGSEETSDSVLPGDLDRYGFTDNRAVGPIMMRLVKEGLLIPTEKRRPSKRAGNHCVPKRIYLVP